MAKKLSDLTANQSESQTAFVIAIDPGRDKCGVAVVRVPDVAFPDVAFPDVGVSNVASAQYRVLESVVERQIAPRAIVISHLETLIERFPDAIFVLGHATTSQTLRTEIAARFPDVALHEQDETGSTLEARELYWQEKPPRGWRKMWPLSLQMPPEPVDDFAAIVLAQRFFKRNETMTTRLQI